MLEEQTINLVGQRPLNINKMMENIRGIVIRRLAISAYEKESK